MMSSSAHEGLEVSEAIKRFVEVGSDWVVLVTGVGSKALLVEAEELGLGEEVKHVLRSSRLAVRGYKTFNALKSLGIKPEIIDDDGTVEGLRRQLEPFDFAGKRVTVQLHGERMPQLTDWLIARGASVLEIPLYFYSPPSEAEVRQLLYEVLTQEVDIVAFTSNTQVKFFFAGAAQQGASDFLRQAFNERVIALAVGSMTSKALRDYGVTRIIAPKHERMGAMVMELAAHFQREPSSLAVLLTGLKRCLVVGGGKVAERKVNSLLEAGIKPLVVSPELSPHLKVLAETEHIFYQAKLYHSSDLAELDLVIAATNQTEVNTHIAQDAKARDILCNVADRTELGTVQLMATVRRGDLQVGVSSRGKSPSLSVYLKAKLEQIFPEGYAVLLEALEQQRGELAKLSVEARSKLFDELTQTEHLEYYQDHPQLAAEHCKRLLDQLLARA
jgi:uroporphyrinogen-III synthase